jgi:hypothetical protein
MKKSMRNPAARGPFHREAVRNEEDAAGEAMFVSNERAGCRGVLSPGSRWRDPRGPVAKRGGA